MLFTNSLYNRDTTGQKRDTKADPESNKTKFCIVIKAYFLLIFKTLFFYHRNKEDYKRDAGGWYKRDADAEPFNK